MNHLMSQSINLYNQLAKKKLFSKSINFNLKRIKLVLKKLNHPEKKLKNVINIIGSDGKYSLLTSLKFFIEANKQKASAYISPSIKDIRERFWLGDKFLSYAEIDKTIKTIEKQKINLTIFEVLTVVFILNAAKKNN
jgi:dihydrofolate synthase/folylpolyglutamate synthase